MKKDIRLIAGMSLIAGYIFFVAALFTPLHSVQAEIYNPGSSGGTTIASGTVLPTIGSPLQIGGSQTSTIAGDTTTSTIYNFNTVLYVPYNFATAGCAGQAVADIGDCINKVYAALPTTGGEIVLPSGSFSFTTPIVFGTLNKIVMLTCPSGGGASNQSIGGTTLTYTPTTGIAIIFNTNAYIVGGSGIKNCNIQGTNGISSRSTGGVVLGGNNGAFSTILDSVNINGFGRGYVLATNTSFNTVFNSTIHFNGTNVNVGMATGTGACGSTCGASGENNKFIGGVIADSNTVGVVTDIQCIVNQLSGNTQLSFIGTSIDDCQYYSNQFGGTANETNFTDVHWENPNGHKYPFIDTITNVPATEISLVDGDMMNDYTPGLDYYISMGGDLSILGTTIDANSPVTTSSRAVVVFDNANNNSTFSWKGLKNNGSASASGKAATWLVSSTVPMSPEGYATGNGLSYYISYDASTTKGTAVYSENIMASSSQYYSAWFRNATSTTSSTAINWNNGNVQSIVLSTSTTFTFASTTAGGRYILGLLQDTTGSRTVTWPSTVHFSGGTAPTLSTASNTLDLVTFVCMGVSSTDCYAGSNLNFAP